MPLGLLTLFYSVFIGLIQIIILPSKKKSILDASLKIAKYSQSGFSS